MSGPHLNDPDSHYGNRMTGGILAHAIRAILVCAAIMGLSLGLPLLSRTSETAATSSPSASDIKTIEGVPLTSTIEVVGTYPANYLPVGRDGLAFSSFAADGNHVALHFLTPTAELTQSALTLDTSVNPAVIGESYIVGGRGGYFVVYDRKTGTLLRKKMFKAFTAPGIRETARRDIWIDGDILTVIVGDMQSSALKRIKLPTLDVIESITAPFQGSFVRWRERYAGIGYFRGESDQISKPSVVVLDHDFRIIAHTPLEVAASGCNFAGFANPTIHDDLLIFSVECGAIRTFDLGRMQPVASHAPASDANFLEFIAQGEYLYTIGAGANASGSVLTKLELKTLRPIRVEHILGKHVVASGMTIYAIQGDGEPSHPLLEVKTYDLGAATSSVLSLDEVLADSQHRAAAALIKTNDVFAAIGMMTAGVPRLGPADMNGLTAESRLRMAWYAGLLVQTHSRSAEGLALLKSIEALAPQDPRIGALGKAGVQWTDVIEGKIGQNASLLGAASTSLTTGLLNASIYVTPDYLVAARWCGTVGEHAFQGSLEPIPRGLMAESQSMDICRAGVAGLAVYDAKNLSFLLYVPIVVSDDQFQENIDSVAVLGHVAYVAIQRRFEQGTVPTVVSIDLKTGREIARTSSGPYEQMRVISGYLFGCADTLRPCKQIDPVTLKVIGDGPEMRLPSAFLTDGEVSQVLSWGLSSYTNTAMALTSTRVLASNGGADAGFKSVRVLDRSEVPITGIRGGFALHGTATPDGKHAYLVLTQASGGQALVRADFGTDSAVTIADGTFGIPAGIVAIDPFIIDWNNSALEVRNSADGSLVCVWPGLLKDKRDPVKMLLMNSGNSLVLTASPSAPDDIQPSVVIDVAKLKSLSTDCGSATLKAKRMLDLAMAPLQ